MTGQKGIGYLRGLVVGVTRRVLGGMENLANPELVYL